MRCYHCGSPNLEVAPVSEEEARLFAANNILLLRCRVCGWHQNHMGDGDPKGQEVENA